MFAVTDLRLVLTLVHAMSYRTRSLSPERMKQDFQVRRPCAASQNEAGERGRGRLGVYRPSGNADNNWFRLRRSECAAHVRRSAGKVAGIFRALPSRDGKR